MTPQATIVPSNAVETRNAFGVKVDILARSSTTNGQYCSYVCTVQPGDGAPLHRHDQFDEAFYVLEGAIEVVVQDEVVQAEAGAYVFMPRGIIHTFRNTSDAPVRFLGIATPGGHDAFFDDVDAISRNGLPPMDEAIKVCIKNGIELVGP